MAIEYRFGCLGVCTRVGIVGWLSDGAFVPMGYNSRINCVFLPATRVREVL